jgi:hypothetical protein
MAAIEVIGFYRHRQNLHFKVNKAIKIL